MTQTQDFQTMYTEEDDQSHQVVVIHSQPSTTPSETIGRKDVRRKDTVCELVGGQALLHSLIGPEDERSPRYLSAKDVRRWNCLAKLLRRPDVQEAVNGLLVIRRTSHDANDQRKPGINIWDLLQSINPKITASLASYQPNFTFIVHGYRWGGSEFVRSWHDDSSLSSILLTLPIAYGGIHLAAWNLQFASYKESSVVEDCLHRYNGDILSHQGIHKGRKVWILFLDPRRVIRRKFRHLDYVLVELPISSF